VADNPAAARYEIVLDGARAGLMTYRLSPGMITFVHTEVEPELQGRGLGGRLVGHALDDARARSLTVRPLCPFVADFIERNPAYSDLVG
jgi:predicted GNAT family acetyltransferase